MQVSIIAAAILVCGIATANQCGKQAVSPFEGNQSSKIVGGRVANKNSWPWQAHLIAEIDYWGIFTSTQAICGASIIGPNWIATAAHCVLDGVKSFSVRLGQHDSTIQEATAKNYQVKRVIVHPQYGNRNDYDNDIALMELETTIQYTDAISPVCLPPSGSDAAAGTACVVTGWGETAQRDDIFPPPPAPTKKYYKATSNVLRQVNLNVVDRDLCNGPNHYNGWVLDSMICAGRFGIDTCQGDSGGPFVCKNADGAYELVGIVSWGFGCGDANYPGNYARVGKYVPWINSVTGL